MTSILAALLAVHLLVAGAQATCTVEPGKRCGDPDPAACPDGCAQAQNLSCDATKRMCYNSPRAENQPCSEGYACGQGLSCAPYIGKCLSSPRKSGEWCLPDRPAHNCGPGLKCHPVLFKCFSDPPDYNEPCDGKCAEGLSCDRTIATCARLAPVTGSCHAYGAACQAGLECDATMRQCYHSP
ncbi:hypothetical protein Rsub_13286, partial [Raphidocelis subcapitata]